MENSTKIPFQAPRSDPMDIDGEKQDNGNTVVKEPRAQLSIQSCGPPPLIVDSSKARKSSTHGSTYLWLVLNLLTENAAYRDPNAVTTASRRPHPM